MSAVDLDCIESGLNCALCSFAVFLYYSFDLIFLERTRSLATELGWYC